MRTLVLAVLVSFTSAACMPKQLSPPVSPSPSSGYLNLNRPEYLALMNRLLYDSNSTSQYKVLGFVFKHDLRLRPDGSDEFVNLEGAARIHCLDGRSVDVLIIVPQRPVPSPVSDSLLSTGWRPASQERVYSLFTSSKSIAIFRRLLQSAGELVVESCSEHTYAVTMVVSLWYQLGPDSDLPGHMRESRLAFTRRFVNAEEQRALSLQSGR